MAYLAYKGIAGQEGRNAVGFKDIETVVELGLGVAYKFKGEFLCAFPYTFRGRLKHHFKVYAAAFKLGPQRFELRELCLAKGAGVVSGENNDGRLS